MADRYSYKLDYVPEQGWTIRVDSRVRPAAAPFIRIWGRDKAIAKCVELTLQGHTINMDILNDSSTA